MRGESRRTPASSIKRCTHARSWHAGQQSQHRLACIGGQGGNAQALRRRLARASPYVVHLGQAPRRLESSAGGASGGPAVVSLTRSGGTAATRDGAAHRRGRCMPGKGGRGWERLMVAWWRHEVSEVAPIACGSLRTSRIVADSPNFTRGRPPAACYAGDCASICACHQHHRAASWHLHHA